MTGDPQATPPAQGQSATPATPPATTGDPATPPATPVTAEEHLQALGLLPAGFTPPAASTTATTGQPPATPASTPATTTPATTVTDPNAPAAQPAQAGQPATTAQPNAADVRAQQIDVLAKQHYALDKDTVEAMRAEGNDALIELIPRINATVFADAVTATMQQVVQVMPTLLAQHEQQQSHRQKYEDAFHNFWDSRGFDLREHSTEIASYMRAYVNANPKSTIEDVMTNAGAQLIIAKQITPKGQAATTATPPGTVVATNGNGVTPPASTTPGVTTPAVDPATGQPPPFQSAATSAATASAPTPQGQWGQFFQEIESADFDD